MKFEELMNAWPWKPIPRCPGRYVLSGPQLPPTDLLAPSSRWSELSVPAARDPVLIASLEDGGLISYRRKNGSFVHTLNTKEGFKRKLSDLKIEL